MNALAGLWPKSSWSEIDPGGLEGRVGLRLKEYMSPEGLVPSLGCAPGIIAMKAFKP